MTVVMCACVLNWGSFVGARLLCFGMMHLAVALEEGCHGVKGQIVEVKRCMCCVSAYVVVIM